MDYGKIMQVYVFDEKSHVKKIEVTYTITGSELDPRYITSSTGINPFDSWRRGDSEVKINKRTGQKGICKKIHGLWRVSSKGRTNSQYINDHIDCVLSIIEPQKDFFKELCSTKDYRVIFHIYRECYDVQGFFCISSENLIRMADLCQEIEFLCPIDFKE
jgi:hypothetical protein